MVKSVENFPPIGRITLERSALRGTGKPQQTERTMIATEKTRLKTTYYLSFLGSYTTGSPTIERTAFDATLAAACSFGYWESNAPDQTYSIIPHGWTEEPFEPVEPFSERELWEAEGCPTHTMVGGKDVFEQTNDPDSDEPEGYWFRLDGVMCEVDGYEQPETLPEDSPGVPEPLAHPARHSVRSEVSDSIVLTGYAQCTFAEYPDLTPDDREDIRQELAAGLCAMADRAIASGRTPRIRRDLLRAIRDRLVARKRKESVTLPSVAVADEHAAAEARERLETERMTRQANAWRLHLVEMERLNQMQPAATGTRLL